MSHKPGDPHLLGLACFWSFFPCFIFIVRAHHRLAWIVDYHWRFLGVQLEAPGHCCQRIFVKPCVTASLAWILLLNLVIWTHRSAGSWQYSTFLSWFILHILCKYHLNMFRFLGSGKIHLLMVIGTLTGFAVIVGISCIPLKMLASI